MKKVSVRNSYERAKVLGYLMLFATVFIFAKMIVESFRP
jgi:hypothetical protein